MGTRPKTAAGRYSELAMKRSPYLQRARDCAELTIPSILPREGQTGAMDLPTPYQGMGARGVNNLAAKLLLALLPANQAFFRLMLDDYSLEELAGSPDLRSEIEEALSQYERTIQSQIETTPTRPSLFEAIKHLIVTGNVLIYVLPEFGLKVFRLDKYVVKRDPTGEVVEIIIKESISPATLPEELREMIDNLPGETANDQTVDLYTWIRRDGDMFHVHQEIKGEVLEGTDGEFPLDRCPFIPLRWTKIDGEDYGRGHVEEYMGDLRSLEGLTKAIVEGSAAAAKVLFLVNPNGITNERTIASAPNLAVRTGTAEDVTVLKVDKFADFRVAFEAMNMITMRLSQAFLLVSSVQREAERVTAEEIRLVATELEDALGGVYSILSQEFQLPYVRRLMFQMVDQGKLPPLPEDRVQPAIVTGMDALGRGHDLNQLIMWAQTNIQAIGVEAFLSQIHINDFVRRTGVSLSIALAGLLKTKEEVQMEQQQAQQQMMMQQLGPDAMRLAAQQQGQTE